MGTVAVLLLIPCLAAAQEATQERLDVAGVVADVVTGEPIAGAAISIDGTRIRTLTNADGRFVLRGIPRGEQTWVIESLGYATWRQPLTVAHLDQLKIGLMPRPVDLEAITVTVDRLAERRRLASYSIHTVSKEELRSSTAIEAAELVGSRTPWPKVGCPSRSSGPPPAPGTVPDETTLRDPGQRPYWTTELCIRYRGGLARPGICLDERPIPLAVLSAYAAEEIYAIDYVGGPTPQVRVYTERFLASGKPVRPLAFGCK